jgi:hypothetical protein
MLLWKHLLIINIVLKGSSEFLSSFSSLSLVVFRLCFSAIGKFLPCTHHSQLPKQLRIRANELSVTLRVNNTYLRRRVTQGLHSRAHSRKTAHHRFSFMQLYATYFCIDNTFKKVRHTTENRSQSYVRCSFPRESLFYQTFPIVGGTSITFISKMYI